MLTEQDQQNPPWKNSHYASYLAQRVDNSFKFSEYSIILDTADYKKKDDCIIPNH